MKDLIIGACHNYTYDQIKCWVNSVKRSGFDGDLVLISFDDKQGIRQKARDAGVIVVEEWFNPDFAVHVQRFASIYSYLCNNPNKYAMVITTDVRDVVFQSNPSTWIEDHIYNGYRLIFASECLRYKHEPWGDNNLLETYGPFVYQQFRNNEIFNVGVLAGFADHVRDLCLDIALNSINRPIKICDQAVFNVMISNAIYRNQALKPLIVDGWCINLGTTADPSKMDHFRPNLLSEEPTFNGTHVHHANKPFVIVHQYDRTMWHKQIERIYS